MSAPCLALVCQGLRQELILQEETSLESQTLGGKEGGGTEQGRGGGKASELAYTCEMTGNPTPL